MIEILSRKDGNLNSLVSAYYDGEYLYLDATRLGADTALGVRGIQLPKLKIALSVTGDDILLAADGEGEGEDGEGEDILAGIDIIALINDLIESIDLSSDGISVSLVKTSLSVLASMLGIDATLPDLGLDLYMSFNDGLSLGMRASINDENYAGISISELNVGLEPQEFNINVQEYTELKLENFSDVSLTASGEVSLTLEESDSVLKRSYRSVYGFN